MGWSHQAKSRRAAALRSAELWLDQNQHDLPQPLLPALQEQFGLRKADAYRIAQMWNRKRKGRLGEQWGAWLEER
jgi:hypothetical protein